MKKYINREVLYELSYANSQLQKSWEEYAAAEYQSSLIYTEKAQGHIDRALQLHKETTDANQENNLQQPEKSPEEQVVEKTAVESEQEPLEEESLEETEQKETEQENSDQNNSE